MKRKILSIILSVALLLSMVPMAANAAVVDYQLLQPDATTSVTILQAGQGVFYQFVPEYSCMYAFHSISDEDTYAELYDADGKLLYENDDYYDMNFGIECNLEQGKRYVLAVYFLDTLSIGSFDLVTTTCHNVNSTVTKPAGCVTDGLWTHNCTVCGSVWTEVIPAEHCYSEGACTVCGQSMILDGTCGPSLRWRYDGLQSKLNISGVGAMYDYADESVPWQDVSDQISEIVIDDGVTYIGVTAFYAMTSVQNVSIPDSVTGIGDNAFGYCSGLKEIKLPKKLETLGEGAFSYCHRLVDIIIPASVTQIGTGAFQGCSNLSGIWVEEANVFYSSDNHGALFDRGQRNLLQVPAAMDGTYTLPYTVLTIGEFALEGCNRLSALTIPNSVQAINANAFSDCNRLTYLRIPSSVVEIGEGAFTGCTELAGILFDGSAPTITGAIFEDLSAGVYYHAEDATWTEEYMQRCGEGVTWCPILGTSIVVQPQDRVELIGNKITYVVGAYGTNLQYSWWLAEVGSEEFVDTGAIGNVYSMDVTAETVGQRLYCVVTDVSGATVVSEQVTVRAMPVITANERYTVMVDENEENCYVTFVPERSCYYTFSSYGDLDTYCELYDSNYYMLGSGDDGEDQNFSLYLYLEAGKSYILNVRIYDSGTGTFEIDALNTHGYESVDTPPTCVLDGYTTYTCTACGDTYQEFAADRLGHSYVGEVIVPSDCVTPGIRKLTCSVCGDTTTEAMELEEHQYGISVIPPSCTVPGYTTHTCFICGADYAENVITPLGHTEVTDPAVAATCTTSGLTAGRHCTTCKAVTVEQRVIPANGHTYINGVCVFCAEIDPNYSPAVTKPTLTLKAPSLEFKDVITINAFYTAENIQDVVEMGMITYDTKVETWSVDTAAHVIPGATYVESSGRYYSSSQGLHAKYLGNTVYLAIYAKLSDGSYTYSKLVSYSAVQYAAGQLKNSTDTKLKQLVVAMLNYGTQAQLYFGYRTDALANASLTEAQKTLPDDYRSDMVQSVPASPADKQGAFVNNAGFTSRRPAISFEGAFCINYFFAPKYTPDSGITLYYWNAADYNSASVLTPANASGSFKLDGEGTGDYRGDINGIAAKALSEAVYVAAAYKSDGTVWTSGVLGYSIGAYCSSQASKGGAIADLAMATAVYGYHAQQYFG